MGKFMAVLCGLLMGNIAMGQVRTDSTNPGAAVKDSVITDSVKSLQGVNIISKKPLVTRQIDGITYDLQADPDSKSSSVLEMMRKVPYLSLDANDNLLMKGNSNFRIFINGKPSSLMERDPKEVLRSMPASTIVRIEVITTPSSKYDAEGLGGIINIITNKKIGNGWNATLNANFRAPAGGPGGGGSFTLKQGKLGVNIYGGASVYDLPVTAFYRARTETSSSNELLQTGTRSNDSRNGYLGSEISYEIDSLNLLSLQLNLNGWHSDGWNDQRSDFFDPYALQGYRIRNNSLGKSNGLDAAINYQRGSAKDVKRLLTFSYRYVAYSNIQHNVLDLSEQLNYPGPDYKQDNDGQYDEQTAQVDYVRPLRKVTIEAGVKAIMRKNHSDFGYATYDEGSGKYIDDEARSDRFSNDQQILSAYNSYLFTYKQWDFRAGVRLEQTFNDIDFMTTATKVKNDYINLVPSTVISRRFNNNASVNFGFSQRIKRPGINRLNPFVDRSNPNYEITGNPALKPVRINDLTLSYGFSKKLSLNVGLMYSSVSNLDLRVATLDEASGITRITYQNSGSASMLGLNVSSGYPIGKKLTVNVNGNFAWFIVDGLVDGKLVKVRRLMNMVTVSGSYKLPSGFQLSGNMNIRGRSISDLQAYNNGMVSTSVALSRGFMKDKLNVSLYCNNPFRKYRNAENVTEGNNFYDRAVTREYFQAVGGSVNYRFGKLKSGIKKNARGIRNDDMSN